MVKQKRYHIFFLQLHVLDKLIPRFCEMVLRIRSVRLFNRAKHDVIIFEVDHLNNLIPTKRIIVADFAWKMLHKTLKNCVCKICLTKKIRQSNK
jgi:hypothetical protein